MLKEGKYKNKAVGTKHFSSSVPLAEHQCSKTLFWALKTGQLAVSEMRACLGWERLPPFAAGGAELLVGPRSHLSFYRMDARRT